MLSINDRVIVITDGVNNNLPTIDPSRISSGSKMELIVDKFLVKNILPLASDSNLNFSRSLQTHAAGVVIKKGGLRFITLYRRTGGPIIRVPV